MAVTTHLQGMAAPIAYILGLVFKLCKPNFISPTTADVVAAADWLGDLKEVYLP